MRTAACMISVLSMSIAGCAHAPSMRASDLVLQYHGAPTLDCIAGVATSQGFMVERPTREYARFWKSRESDALQDEVTVRVVSRGEGLGSFVFHADTQRRTDANSFRRASVGPDPSLRSLEERMQSVCGLESGARS